MTTTYRDRVAALFKAKPGQWIEWHELAAIGGALAWRTRVSDARRELSMQIDNKVFKLPDGTKVSCYRFTKRSEVVAPEISLPDPSPWIHADSSRS